MEVRYMRERDGGGAGGTSALESQGLDGINDAQSIADAGYAHLPQGVVIQLQQDVASDVVFLERVCVYDAFYVGEPLGDVGVGPGFEKVGKG